MSALWSSDDAVAATGGRSAAAWSATGVSIDSRTLRRDDLFVALAGPTHDGHDFVADAFARGAAAAMVHRDVAGEAGPLLRVTDTMTGLEALAREARARSGAGVIAVTGSVGKTGTKEALRAILAEQGPTHATVGNLNNHWGLPLTLARMPAATRYAVLELGMNHPGELTPLSLLARPDVAVVTTIAPAHVEHFESVAAVAEAKAEIFAGAGDGVAILPRDNEHYALLAARAREAGVARIVGFGGHPASDARLLASMMDEDGSLVTAEIGGRRLSYTVGAPGHHWVINSLAVLAAVEAVGADVERAAEALSGVAAPAGRGARRRIVTTDGSFTLIDESYNASPAAMRAAFEVLKLTNPSGNGRRLAVLGDMLELGGDGPALHAALATALVDEGIDRVFACGPLMTHLFEALPPGMRGAHAADSAALLPHVLAAVAPGDVVCVKGSLGSRMRPIVEALIALEEAPDGALRSG